MLKINAKAPDFTALDQHSKEVSLKSYLRKWVLIYFYPKDDTVSCTKEACMIRDSFPDFTDLAIDVIGISADSVDSHANFAKKYDLPFAILSDPEKHIIKTYEAWGEKSMYGRKYMGILRISYLINPKGIIAKTYPRVLSSKHAKEVLKDLTELKK